MPLRRKSQPPSSQAPSRQPQLFARIAGLLEAAHEIAIEGQSPKLSARQYRSKAGKIKQTLKDILSLTERFA